MSFKVSSQSFRFEMDNIDFSKIIYIYGLNMFTDPNRNDYYKDKTYCMELTVTREFCDTSLLRWVEKIKHNQMEKRDGKLMLFDNNNNVAVIFHLKGCYPVDWSMPELNTTSYQGSINIASETVILAIEAIEISD